MRGITPIVSKSYLLFPAVAPCSLSAASLTSRAPMRFPTGSPRYVQSSAMAVAHGVSSVRYIHGFRILHQSTNQFTHVSAKLDTRARPAPLLSSRSRLSRRDSFKFSYFQLNRRCRNPRTLAVDPIPKLDRANSGRRLIELQAPRNHTFIRISRIDTLFALQTFCDIRSNVFPRGIRSLDGVCRGPGPEVSAQRTRRGA